MDSDDESLRQFAETAMSEIRDHLSDNREHPRVHGTEPTLDEALANNNTRSLDIRARQLENPKVTLWLKDCPLWANDAWTATIYPDGLNSYNGKVTVTFDVRPF
jgi:hypothetical protein